MTQIGGKGQGTWSFAPKTYINFQSAVAWTLGRREQPFYNSRMLGYRSLYMQGLEMYVADGTLATFFNDYEVAVRRPDGLTAHRSGDLPDFRFAYDGSR